MELARAAIDRTAEEMRASIDAQLSGPGTAVERIAAYLRRERDVLRGCPVGRLTQDPDVIAAPTLREPVEETFAWLRVRLAASARAGSGRHRRRRARAASRRAGRDHPGRRHRAHRAR